MDMSCCRRGRFFVLAGWLAFLPLAGQAQHEVAGTNASPPFVAKASDEGEMAIRRFKVAEGLKVELWAAEPMLANPVAFNFDEKGRAYVCETFRLGAGVDDIRGIMDWLDEELASRTVDERLAEMKRHLGERFAKYSERSERIRVIEDRSGKGVADHSTVYAEGFNDPLDGIAAGVLARKGEVWYANIPNLWHLRDTNGDGVADQRKVMHSGFGVRVGFLGHDLHGLHFGPDGKLYFSIGDRGSNVQVGDGRHVGEPDMGCVFRCNPDGSELEVFSYGLRNPQDLVFDQYGNLFTGDNNSDSGDQARWVYVMEGADNGWRVGYQFMENPYSRGPFNAEKLWYPQFEGQAAYIVPPIANVASGPSGVAYFPGTGLPSSYNGHFFLVDFRGGSANSGVLDFTLKPKGAGFELENPRHFIWNILATDVKFGVDGGLYVSDWVEGWGLTGKGRIYRVHDAATDKTGPVGETKRLLAEGMEKRPAKELGTLLSHPDMRVRQEAQFELADRGVESVSTLLPIARKQSNQLARLHAIWGLGQIASGFANREMPANVKESMDGLMGLLEDKDLEVRAQAAKVLGERHYATAYEGLVRLLKNENARVRYFAVNSLGKLGRREALPAIYALLRDNADKDPYLRHGAMMALTWLGDVDSLIAAGKDASKSVRMGALLAMRRLHRSEIAMFLKDPDSSLVLEAARAINDEPINGAMQELAALVTQTTTSEPLLRRVLNANFHFGTTKTAGALATFAMKGEAPENMRIEALQELGDWEHPSGRDRVVGLWRPVAAVRHRETAAEVLQPRLSEILHTAPEPVRIASLRAVEGLRMTSAEPLLGEVVRDTHLGALVRAAALRAMGAMDLPGLEQALEIARKDSDEDLRRAATQLEGKLKSASAIPRLTATLESGSIREKQTALAALGALPGEQADELILKWLDQLPQVDKALQLDVLDVAQKRDSTRVKRRLQRYEGKLPKDDPLASFEPALYGGNAVEGKRIFFEKPEAQCVRCHKINGQGGDVGPDLSHIAAQKDRKYFLESIIQPNKQIAQGFDSVMVILKNGDNAAGVLKSENDKELVLSSADAGLVTVKKADIETRRAALSPMPEGLGQILSKDDIRDLVEYLSSLK